MKCHYIDTKEDGKVLVPYCIRVVHSGDIKDCTCKDGRLTANERIAELEKNVRKLQDKMNELLIKAL